MDVALLRDSSTERETARERETDRQTERERETDRQTDRQTESNNLMFKFHLVYILMDVALLEK